MIISPSTLAHNGPRLRPAMVTRLHFLALLLLLIVAVPTTSHAILDDDSEDGGKNSATLSIWSRDIVTFRSEVGSTSPTERRDQALDRIASIDDFDTYKEIKLNPWKHAGLEGITFHLGDRLLFTIIESDLDPTENKTLKETGEDVRSKLEHIRTIRLEQRSFPFLIRAISYVFVYTLIYLALIWIIRFIFNRIKRVIMKQLVKNKKLHVGEFNLRPLFFQLGRRLLSILFGATILVLTLVWLTLSFARFPFTSPWSDKLIDYVGRGLSDLGTKTLQSIPGVVLVVIIILLTREVVKIVDHILLSFEKSSTENEVFDRDKARVARRIAGLIIWMIAVAIAYPYIPGSESAAFKGLSVLLGVMVSLGSTGIVSQVMSGFVALYSGALRSGEYARMGDVEGTISEIGLLSTKVMTPRNEFVTVPNSLLITKETINYSRSETTQLSTSVTIGYDTPWRQTHDLLLSAAKKTKGIRNKPAPFILQTSLSDFYVCYELRFCVNDVHRRGAILSEIHQHIQDTFAEAGVQIMSPNFVAQPEDPILPPQNQESSSE